MSALANEDTVRSPRLPTEIDSEAMTEVGAEELIVGRTLTRPIYDMEGTLLLAEGIRITSEFKRLLRDRQIRRVKLYVADFPEATLPSPPAQEPRAYFDNALAARLDEVIDSGLLFVVNSESAVLDRMQRLGCKGYNQGKHRELIEQNKETSARVDDMIRAALRGRELDSGEIMRLTARYLGDMTEDIDSVLASVVETVGQKTIASHCINVALLAMAIGIEMGLDATNVRQVGVAALVHDWGMSLVASETLQADWRLNDEEFCEVTRHPIYGIRLLEKLPGVPSVVPIIAYQVHERPNGSGYPQGRTSERIHPLAKIVAVADAFTALTSSRPFRPPLMPYAAMECLLRQASTGDADAEAVRALLMVQSLFPIGSYVLLSDGRVARVVRRNGDKYMSPIVRLVQDLNGAQVRPGDDAAIIDVDQAGLHIVRALGTPGKEETRLNPEIIERPDRGTGCPFQAGKEVMHPDSLSSLFARRGSVRHSSPSRTAVSLEGYTEKQRRQAYWALDFLHKTSTVEDKWRHDARKHERQAIRAVVHVCVPDAGQAILNLHGPNAFRALVGDISPGGLSFVHPAQLDRDHLIVGIDASNNEIPWFYAEVVRSREITEADFWEYGVAFRRRIVV